ncbi:DNA repair protein RecN [Kangiella sp. TOML190]|uniref:DNA repair protein RecN n=1 Tax=Kangiella sp. TOML190 TaxID=2931351 RepID=UPI00203B5373|nr:DNA repair protein RecN [Kangiella sp. TOML190]
MLTSIHIKDFAIIAQLDLDLSAGMTVITGETGAGKSIVVDALGFALGNRADSGVVRHGAKRAEISAIFDIEQLPKVQNWLEEQMLDEEQDCILRRVINHDGRSKAFVNGQPVNLAQLSELGDFLVDIHGQHEHQSLFKPQTHLQLLDRYAGLSDKAVKLAELAKNIQHTQGQLNQFQAALKDKNDRKDLLNYQLEELSQAPIDRAQQIENEHKRAANASQLLTKGQASLAALNDDEQSIASTLNSVAAQISELYGVDDNLKNTHDLLQSALVEIDEASAELRNYLESVDMDPEQLQQLDSELSQLHDLSRKHQTSIQALPEVLASLEDELTQLAGDEASFGELEQELAKLQTQYQKLAQTISKKRQTAAKKLNTEIVALMQQLGLGNGVFEVAFKVHDAQSFKSIGLERAEFMVSTNPGQQPMPLRKVASGGELSRISLALQVINAQTTQLPTLIFDEVDVGIGGSTAETVGKLLKSLGAKAQILCVTHQAQVAAQGHQHLLVAKSQSKTSTSNQMLEISCDERVEEIARMIGGVEITETIRSHAKELLAQ